MIRDIKKLRGGYYGADFRFDEGIRVREEGVFPCLCSSMNGEISKCILLIEVINENQEPDNNGLLGSL